MKVVLFCGGLGLRLREYSEKIPKPMASIGLQPILWHVMRYYAHFGHKDFILCLGWKGEAIKEYFLRYNECLTNDFVLSSGGKRIEVLNRDIADWQITFVDTGTNANIGQRLKAVQRHLGDDEEFLANYSDGLTDLCLPAMIDFFRRRRAVAALLAVRPKQSFHSVKTDGDGLVREIEPISQTDTWMNGGYFVFRREIFDNLADGEELVEEPFRRLMAQGRLVAMKHEGFWGCMDTYKEKQLLDDMFARGDAPWEVWKQAGAEAAG